MRSIDLNADTGEANTPEWQATEAAVLAWISSANIACGGHAGNDETMRRTVKLAKQYGVNIGAHPAYPDKENFGRKSFTLGDDISKPDLKAAIMSQISRLAEIAAEEGCALTYVKAHGALYNDAVFSTETADLIAFCVARLDQNLILMGAPNSCLTKAAHQAGLKFVAEGFVDRRYTDDGHLQSRRETGAVIEDQAQRTAQALALLAKTPVTTASGQKLTLVTDTLCLHSDSPGAGETAKSIRRAIEKSGGTVKAFTHG